jgi:hypothetical protein
MSRTYTVDAKRWEHGWELHADDGAQVLSKDEALALISRS